MASKTASKVHECSREHYENLGRVCRRCCIKCIAADSRSKNHGRNALMTFLPQHFSYHVISRSKPWQQVVDIISTCVPLHSVYLLNY